MSYSREQVLKHSLKYFKNEKLPANVWINKYALKDSDGNIYEKDPNDMHDRIANELARIEQKYNNPISKDDIFNLIKDFKYIVPQGSPMSGIGNNNQTVSLSNCFVVGNNADSYGGIFLTDQEQAQLMKRRGGVGHDLSHIRPKGTSVKNSALSSTGVVPFMERYSNTTREVAQDGRRGALMLSINIKHPDSEEFIDAKMEKGKVTGANVSVKITDEFMTCVKENKKFVQQYPIDSDNPTYKKEIDANHLWGKIVKNAWKSAEPGILFWDNIVSQSVPDCYGEDWKTTSTNPCGEIPLCPYDSCRLLAINLYSYVKNPFTEKAEFDWELFKSHVKLAQRFMDDIIDLEIEKIDKIIEKIKNDPEDEFIKVVEINLWEKIKDMTLRGRRTGVGVTAEGDMLAAMGFTYGTKEGTNFSESVHKTLATYAYISSIEMAKERGSFTEFDYEKEKENPFHKRVMSEVIKVNPEYLDMLKEFGRRNIALLTVAPTGTVSLMTQTTSGIEPVFLPVHERNRKVNPNDKGVTISFIDELGDAWETYKIFHPKFLVWLGIKGYNIEEVKKMDMKDMNEIIKLSPYYKATSADVDWVEKVKMQGAIQKWVDHSISVTVNLPEDVTEEVVGDVYKTGWESGCKGITVYREGSRSGVLVSVEENKKKDKEKKDKKDKKEKTVNEIIKDMDAAKRPKDVECDIIRFVNKGQKWIGFVGLIEGNPYEVFTGIQDSFPVPSYVEKGIIRKFKKGDEKRYDFVYHDKDGYEQEIKGLSRAFKQDYWDYAKMISAVLRHHMPIASVINLLDSLLIDGDLIGTWKAGIKRMLKKYVTDGIEIGNGKNKCPQCGQDSLVFQDGCIQCINEDCGHSKCG
jgi:ribonucleoside-diphosphate reductase alpha chain